MIKSVSKNDFDIFYNDKYQAVIAELKARGLAQNRGDGDGVAFMMNYLGPDKLDFLPQEDIKKFYLTLGLEALLGQVLCSHFQALYNKYNEKYKFPMVEVGLIGPMPNPWGIYVIPLSIQEGISTKESSDYNQFALRIINEKFGNRLSHSILKAIVEDADIKKTPLGQSFIEFLVQKNLIAL